MSMTAITALRRLRRVLLHPATDLKVLRSEPGRG